MHFQCQIEYYIITAACHVAFYSIDSRMLISTDMTTRNIKTSDGLPVGRYLLIVTEIQTGAEGYERFSITSREY